MKEQQLGSKQVSNSTRFMRLTQWRDYLNGPIAKLVKRKPHKFDMEYWSKGPKSFKPTICTTAACAGGWATVRFRNLKLTHYQHYDNFEHGIVKFDEQINERAISAFFGISLWESKYITISVSPNYRVKNVKPKHVVKNIDKIIKDYKCGNGECI